MAAPVSKNGADGLLRRSSAMAECTGPTKKPALTCGTG